MAGKPGLHKPFPLKTMTAKKRAALEQALRLAKKFGHDYPKTEKVGAP